MRPARGPRARILRRPRDGRDSVVLSAAARMNLTRDEAQARARLLDVDVVRRRARPHRRATSTFRLDDDGRGSAAPSRAPRPSSTWSPTQVDEVTLNGRPLDPATVYDGTPASRSTDLAADNELRSCADCRYMHTGEGLHRFVDPVDKPVYLYTQFEVADARRVFTVFDQPDLKATFAFTVTAPDDWAGRLQPADAGAGAGRTGQRDLALRRRPQRHLDVHHRAGRRARTTAVDGEYRDGDRVVPLGVYCRASLAAHLDADAIFEVTRQGFDFFEEKFDYALPVRQVRPAVRAGVQRGRDGERRLRDVPRGLRLPVAGDRGGVRAAGRDDPARDGAHVVRRPGHHALVGRPVAERVVRRVGQHAGRRPRRPGGRRPGRRSPTPRRPGPTGRTSCRRRTRSPPTSTTSRTSRSTSTASPTPRAPRCSSSWSPGSGGTSSSPGCGAYFRDHAWGNTTLADLLGELEETSGRDLKAWSEEWLETAGVNTLRPEFEIDDDGPVHLVRRRAGGAPERWPTLRSHRLAIGLYDLHRRPAGARATGSSSTSRRAAPRCPSWSARRSRTWSWSTTTT